MPRNCWHSDVLANDNFLAALMSGNIAFGSRSGAPHQNKSFPNVIENANACTSLS